jgi:CheY-like chemotaxis protein
MTVPAPFGARRDAAADAELQSHGYARTLALARRLAAGADSQDEVVRRVHSFLAKYRYATDAPDRARPLDAFLFEDRSGSCQHFAGAAALLLRLAGVPARVAVGFAPGERDSDGRWLVRDRDAHAWVEVWYRGLGWVAVDPTPPAGKEATARPAGRAVRAPLVGFSLLGAWGLVAWRRRPRGTAADLLVRLARRTGDVATLRESADVLGRTVGRRTAGLALAAERARYGRLSSRAPRRGAVVRAVWADRGPIRAAAALAVMVLRGHDSATSPSAGSRVVPTPPPRRRCDHRGMARVLVVDDDPSFVALARRILEDAGITVAATEGTAAAALATAHALKPDAVLVDVGLPDRDGIELARELVALPWRPRVVLTSTDPDAIKGPGADGLPPFVPKENLPGAPLYRLLVGDEQ